MATLGFYGLNYWETVEDRWVHAAMHLTIHVIFTAIVPGAYPGEGKMWLKHAHSLTSTVVPVPGARPQLTHVQLAIAILRV